MLINIETTKVLGMTLCRRKGLWWWWHDRCQGWGLELELVENDDCGGDDDRLRGRQGGGWWIADSPFVFSPLCPDWKHHSSWWWWRIENIIEWSHFLKRWKQIFSFFQTKVERWGFLRWVLFDTPVFVFNTWPCNFITNNNVVVFDTNVTMNTIKTVSDIFCFVVIGTI